MTKDATHIKIERDGKRWKIKVMSEDVILNAYPADTEGMVVGIARKQMERLK